MPRTNIQILSLSLSAPHSDSLHYGGKGTREY